MISKAWPVGPFWHFNLLNTTGEFTFDHHSDHVQGMLVIEAIRQAGIAHMHLVGLSLDGVIALSVLNTRFHNFISPHSPILIRTFRPTGPTRPPQTATDCVLCGLYQWGKLCAEAQLVGTVFDKILAYEHQRARSMKILARTQRMYASNLNSLTVQQGAQE